MVIAYAFSYSFHDTVKLNHFNRQLESCATLQGRFVCTINKKGRWEPGDSLFKVHITVVHKKDLMAERSDFQIKLKQ